MQCSTSFSKVHNASICFQIILELIIRIQQTQQYQLLYRLLKHSIKVTSSIVIMTSSQTQLTHWFLLMTVLLTHDAQISKRSNTKWHIHRKNYMRRYWRICDDFWMRNLVEIAILMMKLGAERFIKPSLMSNHSTIRTHIYCVTLLLFRMQSDSTDFALKIECCRVLHKKIIWNDKIFSANDTLYELLSW